MEGFLTKTHCDRCGDLLKKGRALSMFSDECLCFCCKKMERKNIQFDEAVAKEMAEIKKGNRLFAECCG